MKICWVENFSETNPEPQIEALRKRGHTVTMECDETYDWIICASIYKENIARSLRVRYPNVKLANYCWDFYKWAWEGKHDLNWRGYHTFLKDSDLVMVPSKGQQKRLKELGIDSVVVLTSITCYDHKTRDDRFVLDHLRWYPEPNREWVVKACEDIGIPVNHSEHQYSDTEFKDIVSSCTLLACGYLEASTGGLTLVEALWNGKPSLISDSPYMGGADYLGEFGFYFKHDDFEDLKKQLRNLFDNPPKIDIVRARKYINKNFSHEAMAKRLEDALCEGNLK